jgi:hypothetical protein
VVDCDLVGGNSVDLIRSGRITVDSPRLPP